jgi:hypothetical protein
MLSTTPVRPVFTAGNAKTQTTETKHVSKRELCAPLQLPIGDDVSALHPLHRSVPFALAPAEAAKACVTSGVTIAGRPHRIQQRNLTVQIENGCFIMQG